MTVTRRNLGNATDLIVTMTVASLHNTATGTLPMHTTRQCEHFSSGTPTAHPHASTRSMQPSIQGVKPRYKRAHAAYAAPSILYYEVCIVPHIERSDECTASHTAVCCTLLLVRNEDGVPTKRCTLTLGQVPKGQLGRELRLLWVDELTVEWMKGMELWTGGTWNCECMPRFLVSKTLVQVYILDPDAPADGPQNDPARSSPSTHPSGTVPAAEIMS
ncbi:hypothetical protein B0H10DRAFT_1941793 [Mycena sp. CBHHK59/15]|nr:hypothetical protein B0H10DRAFT_1941793 [Mycena sp. CBHHK59/15]